MAPEADGGGVLVFCEAKRIWRAYLLALIRAARPARREAEMGSIVYVFCVDFGEV